MGICESINEGKTNTKKSMINMKNEKTITTKSLLKGIIISSYIFNKIFSNLNEIRKLNLIRHNNYFQKNLSINIEYYMKMSGRYKVGGINGNGKEYEILSDELLFEGEYKNGKRNGKGKEYNNGKIMFEGEYLNGKRHGKGKEYEFFKKVIFEGEYLNGKRWNGNFINRIPTYKPNYHKLDIDKINKNKDGKLEIYKIINGKGKIKIYDEDRLIFEGEYLNGEINGKGKEYFHYGYYDRDDGRMIYYDKIIIFEGEYLNGFKWNGKGYDKDNNIACEIKNGKGNLKSYYDDGNLLSECEILNGEKNGKCKIYRNEELQLEKELIYFNGILWNGKEYNDDNHLIYEGEYLNYNKWKGKFKEYNHLNFLMSEGEYLNGKKWNEKGYDNKGNIIYEIKNGVRNFEIKIKDSRFDSEKMRIIYEKNYLNNKGFKKGKEYNFYNQLLYEGEFLNGERNGKGKEYDDYNGKLMYEGEFIDGKRNGKGKEYNDEGKVIFEGEFKNGDIWNGYGEKGWFEGEFKNGKIYNTKPNDKNRVIKNGEGYVKLFNTNGLLLFEGEYKNGEENGKGKEYDCYKGKLKYEGEYKNGEKNGKGKEYDSRGNVIFEGEFKNGEWMKGKRKEYDYDNQLISEKNIY